MLLAFGGVAMRIIFKFLTAAAIVVPVTAMAADSVQMTPGRWEERMNLISATLAGQNLPVDGFPGQNQTEYSCISPAEAADPAAYFLSHSSGDGCDPHGTVANGHISISGTCMRNDRPMQLVLDGTYGRDTYRVTAQATTSVKSQSMVMNIVMDARYVGACKGDEKKRSGK